MWESMTRVTLCGLLALTTCSVAPDEDERTPAKSFETGWTGVPSQNGETSDSTATTDEADDASTSSGTSSATTDNSGGTDDPIWCGDGVAEGNEPCDGDDLRGETCQSRGYEAGPLRCSPVCTYDETGCINGWCGDGTQDAGEQCDGFDLGGKSCQSLGFAGGALTCQPNCLYDTTGCANAACGNGVCEGGEDSCSCPVDCPDEPWLCSPCECGASGGNCYCDVDCALYGDCCLNAPC